MSDEVRLVKTCGHVAYRDHHNDCIDYECTNAAYQIVGAERCPCRAETGIGGQTQCLLFDGHKAPHRYSRVVELSPAARARVESRECPAWSDGQHCYDAMGISLHGVIVEKRCACGKVVPRTPTPEGK